MIINIPDTEILTKAKILSIYIILMHSQPRWAGQVCRMNLSRLPKMLFYGELPNKTGSVEMEAKS